MSFWVSKSVVRAEGNNDDPDEYFYKIIEEQAEIASRELLGEDAETDYDMIEVNN